MPLEKEFTEMEALHRQFLVDYEGLTVGKKKVSAARARKSLMEIAKLAKVMRASITDYKEKL